jgi:uncharacterized membrane protein HdeD (DUF308 family)
MNRRTNETEKPERLARPESAAWGGTFTLGLLWTIAGVSANVATGFATLAAIYYVGALLVVAGGLGLWYGLRGAGAGLITLSVLSLVLGGLLLAHPGRGMGPLSLLAIGYFLMVGLFRAVTSVMDRQESWAWDFAYGVCAIGIALIAARAWPLSSFWLLGVLVGVELIVRGLDVMMGAVGARHASSAAPARRAS